MLAGGSWTHWEGTVLCIWTAPVSPNVAVTLQICGFRRSMAEPFSVRVVGCCGARRCVKSPGFSCNAAAMALIVSASPTSSCEWLVSARYRFTHPWTDHSQQSVRSAVRSSGSCRTPQTYAAWLSCTTARTRALLTATQTASATSSIRLQTKRPTLQQLFASLPNTPRPKTQNERPRCAPPCFCRKRENTLLGGRPSPTKQSKGLSVEGWLIRRQTKDRRHKMVNFVNSQRISSAGSSAMSNGRSV